MYLRKMYANIIVKLSFKIDIRMFTAFKLINNVYIQYCKKKVSCNLI